MIVLDTHVWLWWVFRSASLPTAIRRYIENHETKSGSLGVSVFSCWEVAKLVEVHRVELPDPIDVWMPRALAYPGVRLLDLTPDIAIESTRLPGAFHKDPADRIIVATARLHDCPLATADTRILTYPHVKLVR